MQIYFCCLKKHFKNKKEQILNTSCFAFQLLRKPEKADDGDTEKPKDKPKKQDRERQKEDRPSGGDPKKRQNGEHREDKGGK